MPKRKKQLAAIAAPETISSLHEEESIPDSEAATNTALPDVATSLSPLIATSIALAATNTAVTALPDVVTSLPPAAVDAEDDAKVNTDAVNSQSNYHPRASDPSTSTQEIKLEPVVKIETSPAPVPANPSNDQAEAPRTTEPVRNGPNLNRTVTVRRKAAKRTDLEPSPQSIVVPLSLSPSPQAEEIPARKKPRVEEPLPTTTDEAARKTASPATPPSTDAVQTWTRRRSRRQIELSSMETSASQPLPITPDEAARKTASPATPPSTNAVHTWTRRRNRRQTELSSMGTSASQPDGADDACIPPNTTVNSPTRRRTSRRVIPTSSTGTPLPPPSTTTVNVSTCRRSRR
jgi:hypothetical protein